MEPKEDIWKQFDQNPITHSAAHHLVAIAELREGRGYARVSDVAKELNITRGSASLTLKALKQKGLVEEDDNRFILLSKQGRALADAVRAKKFLIKKFLIEVLDVHPENAEIDTCKIEHLVSHHTAQKLVRFLRFVESDDDDARSFMRAWRSFNVPCGHDPQWCPACYRECLDSLCEEPVGKVAES